jgi:hypothetical protein
MMERKFLMDQIRNSLQAISNNSKWFCVAFMNRYVGLEERAVWGRRIKKLADKCVMQMPASGFNNF